jgi:DNA-binding NtrC family response regulator
VGGAFVTGEAPGPGRRYRLRGEVGGIERSYPLGAGETRIGSVAGNDMILPVRGVSRRHAVVRLADGALTIEDLQSRNGVLVNGARAVSARLKAGDEVRLGPVALRLEEIDVQDVALAIALDPPRASSGPSSEETTSAWSEPSSPPGWLAIVEGFVERLSIVPEADVAGALALLVGKLPARGCSLFEWRGHDPVIVAAAGDVGAVAGVGRPETWPRFQTTDADRSATTWALAPSQATPAGMVVWGDYPGRAASESLLRVLLRLWQRLRSEPLRTPQESPPAAPRGLVFPEGFVPGESPAMVSLYGQMKPLLQGDLPVLLVGETGVGKELIARTLHASGARAKGPFVAINCAAIPSELLEAEMFGIGKGVATGVVERPGRFQLANGGTLFLDEIGDMSLDLQAKLLRAVQEKEIQPVGSAPVPVDLRVVTATNSDLLRRIEEGRFRRDLYYRIAGYVLRVPPLRERREDVAALVEAFLRAFSHEIGKPIQGITLKALRALVDHAWPGNVRELEHEVRRLVYLCAEGGAVDSALLSAPIIAPVPAVGLPETDATSAGLDLDEHLRRVEERLIRQALARAGGNRTQAAKLLGVSRNGLSIKLQRLGIAP